MSEETKVFWLVWNPLRGIPQHRHTTEELAWKEAERLSIKHPDNKFFVLKSCGVAWATATSCKLRHEEYPSGAPW